MSHKMLRTLALLALLGVTVFPLTAYAHETVTVGGYAVEYGWLNEPPVVGQPNAVVINIAQAGAGLDSGTISLMAPADNAMVMGNKADVTVQFTGLDAQAGEQGAHWHLYVDDQMLAMLPLDQTTATVAGLPNGMHTIKATLSGADHVEVGQAATAMINVEGASASGQPAVTGVNAMPMSDAPADSAGMDVDVSKLQIEVSYGGQSKTLTLQPLGEDTPGQFIAPLTPMRAGEYTVKLSGKIGEADVNTEVKPEEVQSADIVQFPKLEAESQAAPFGLAGWLAIGGLVLGLLGTGLGAAAVLRRK